MAAIGHAHGDVVAFGSGQVFAGGFGQFGVDFQRGHILAQAREQGGHVARAGADLQHALMGLQLQVVGHAGINLGGQHAMAALDGKGIVAQGDFDVHKGFLVVRRGHKVFTAQAVQHF